MYILASHLYGPRGQVIPRPTPKKMYTYNQLATKFDAFSNVMVQMEEAFPFSNQTPLPVGKLLDDSSTPLANVFGFAGIHFFAIPSNPNVAALGVMIDDWLFKICNSQDINSVFCQLPLFEPPIDPALLLLLAKALEMAQEVRLLGSSLLATCEKGDAEALSVLWSKHDTNM
ncbi:putative Insecticidal toxin complex protein TccB2 [Aspergillus udagawae]|uniref:Insecticidal toxin complex protein TccB2 n=1 Tax=Aspergillus udagawae TaxID=91492 RepID=A0A8E0V558_9EURO|nr:putative Insecticidal toxin complex protein TccB2 [Aspergillus udagawae]GIC94465.1 putative Insecticidal toxin complex protein TccB2 [Aspergillus udagawae]